jgi:hypothetical protein
VLARDQFGLERLSVEQTLGLCVPASKRELSQAEPVGR